MKITVFLFFFISCSHNGPGGTPSEGKTTYSYSDVSGSYRLVREVKRIQKKLVTRSQLFSTSGSNNRVLEKSITVSQIGSIKLKSQRQKLLRPSASEFTVWLEGKKYQSRMQLLPTKKAMRLSVQGPEKKWNGISEISFPKGKYFCFFSQIPECLYQNYLLQQAYEIKNKRFDFYVVWDSFPMLQDQMSGVGKSMFAVASVKFDGEVKKTFRYIVEVEGQYVVYHFSKAFDMMKMSWIAQGITIVPPGEEVAAE